MQGVGRSTGVGESGFGLQHQRHRGGQQARDRQRLDHAQTRRRAVLGGPEVAHPYPHQRDGAEQARHDQQAEQGPGGWRALLQQRRQHGQLGNEAGQRRQTGRYQRADREGHAQERQCSRNGTADERFLVVVEVGAGGRLGIQERGQRVVAVIQLRRAHLDLAHPLQQLHQQEQGAAGQGGTGQVEERAAAERRGVEADCGDQRAGGGDHGIAGQPRQLLRRQHADRTEGQRGEATPDQHVAAEARRCTRAGRKTQGPQPQHGVHADLGQDGKHRCGRCAGSGIGRRQPEVQRPQPGLRQEGDGQDRRSCVQQAAVAGRHRRQLLRDVSHVQCAGDAVEHRHADQEQQ
mmetsp:Transcript_44565/g.104707  ORF Transcript_44565/g.104707 Transcript_44565/m.104707 type:complete len:348 (+) Transcript_44565:3040-4083(+)